MLRSIKKLVDCIAFDFGDLGEGYTIEDAVFYGKYHCWPEEVREYLSLPLNDKRRLWELSKRSLAEHLEEYRSKGGGFGYVADAIASGKRIYRPVNYSSLDIFWADDFYFDTLPSQDCFFHLIFWVRDFIAHYELNALTGGLRVEDTRYVCSFVTSMRHCSHALLPEQRFNVSELVSFYAQNAVFENQYAFLLKSLLLDMCDFLKKGGIDQDGFNRELESLRGSMLRVGESVSPLGYDESFDDAVFCEWYECWPDEVKALYTNTDSNIQLQYSRILKQDIKEFSESWSFDARPDSFVTARSILEGKRIFRDYLYVDYEEYFNDQLGGFEYLSGRSYIFFMAIWFKQVLRNYQRYWAGANVDIDHQRHWKGVRVDIECLESMGDIYISWHSKYSQPEISHDARMVFMVGFKFLLKYNAFRHSYGVRDMMHILFLINGGKTPIKPCLCKK